MLTNEQIQSNKIRYLTLLSELYFDLTDLTEFLDKIDYWNAPLTIKTEKSYNGGLCESALLLYDKMILLKNALNIDSVSNEDIINVALFRNFYKCALYENCIKKVKNDTTGQWEDVLGYQVTNNRPMYGSSGFSSLLLAEHFVSFTDSQKVAIVYSGLNETNTQDIFEIFRSRPLVVLTHLADVTANFLGE